MMKLNLPKTIWGSDILALPYAIVDTWRDVNFLMWNYREEERENDKISVDCKENLDRSSFERRARNLKTGKDGGKIDGV